jgi:amino acid adenylation domain-containing protein
MSSSGSVNSDRLAGAEREVSTLLDLLQRRARLQPNRPAYTFLADGEAEAENLTYGELDRRARAAGALLQSFGLTGERALLLYPAGLDYVTAFYGCLYAGVVAVPVNPARLNRNISRLQSILEGAQAAAVLSPAATLSRLEPLIQTPELKKCRWLATDTVRAGAADELREPTLTGDMLAYLQYTSGSTSAPKGVMVSHANIMYNSAYIDEGFEHTAESVSLTWLPHFHDMGLIYGILQPVYKGFHGFIMSPASFVQRPARWLEAITRYKITHSGGPNFAYDLCVRKVAAAERAALDLSSWEVAFNGAEPVRGETLDQFKETFAPCGFRPSAFYAAYGLAEATLKVSGGRGADGPLRRRVSASGLEQNQVVAAGANEEDARVLVSSGRAGSGTEVLIVNPETSFPCAAGEVGEIWVSGAGVAQGYWNCPTETKRTFQAYPAGTGAGARYLRTGDLGFLSDGELFVTGRLKDMIIIRGLNHYPQDIELTAGRSHPQLSPSGCAAFSVEVRGEERLAVVQEIRPRAGVSLGAVAEAIRQSVAEMHELQVYAVALVKPGGVPKTSSGKVQRRACRKSFLEGSLHELERSLLPESNPAAEASALQVETLLTLPPAERSARLKKYLREQVARTLNIAPQATNWQASLPALGLDSLTAIELKNLIEVDLKVVVPLVDFLQDASVEQLAWQVDEQLAADAAPLTPDPLVPTPDSPGAPGAHPLSYGQKSLWFLYQLAPRSAAYNIARAIRLREKLDVRAFRDAFQTLVDRHPSLRTTFAAADGEPLQQIHTRAQVCFEEEDASGRSESFLESRLTEEAHRPFDLERGPLLRVKLFRRSPEEHVLLIAVHHIIGDFWSLGILMRELATLYAGRRNGSASNLTTPRVQYADYTRWQAKMLAAETGERLWTYWREQLAGELPDLNLPTDHVRPAMQTYQGRARAIRLDAHLTRRLKSLATERGASLYTVLLAAFQVLLHRYTGQEDILTGSPTSGRSRPELAELVGYFANPVVLRANLAGNPAFADFLAQVRQTVLAALDHQEFPFALLVERLQIERNPSRSPLFQVMFVLQQTQVRDEAGLTLFALGEAGGRVNLNGLALESMALEQRVAQFDLTLMMAGADEELTASIEYNTGLFDAATITRMLGHFQTLLEGIVADPARRISDLPLLAAPERQQLLEEWNHTSVPYRHDQCIHQLFEAQAARRPHDVAVVAEDGELTYAELNRRANRLAGRLRGSGVRPETLVALCMERSARMLVGLLGILKAGAAYVPLDPTYPRERLAFMLEDASVRVLVTETALLPVLSSHDAELILLDAFEAEPEVAAGVVESVAGDGGDNPASGVAPDNLAYVIYTSGSLGRPKGVMVAHRNVSNFFTGMDHALGSTEPGVWLALTSISFDISVLELFWTLARGFRVVIHGAASEGQPEAFAALVAKHRVTHLQCTPSRARMLASDGASLRSLGSLQTLLVGGEALPASLARQLCDVLTGEMHNMYGPTETTIWSTTQPLGGDDCRAITIGRPIANTEVFILDRHLQPLLVGVPGELFIGGEGVVRGYGGRPETTAERFIPHPFARRPGARLYRTGDLARYLPNGEIEYLGRLDQQIKLRGFRIELGEIESALREHPHVDEAVVIAREDDADDRRLVAYVVGAAGTNFSCDELRGFLKEKLPEYMLPAVFVPLGELPLTPNGKVDRRALPAPEQSRRRTDETYVAPRTPVEETLAQIWADVLKVGRVGIYDNFFSAGGHSLLMTQVVSRIRDTFRVELPIQSFFQEPKVADLAMQITQMRAAQKGDDELGRLLEEIERQ